MLAWIASRDFADILALLFLVAVLASLWRLHHTEGNGINIFDLVMEGGKLAKLATAFWAAFGVLAWIMIKLTQSGAMTEGYFIGFGGLFVAPIIAKIFSLPAPAGSTTTFTSKTVENDPPQPEQKP